MAQGAASRWRKGAPDSCDARSVSRVAGPGAAATEGAARGLAPAGALPRDVHQPCNHLPCNDLSIPPGQVLYAAPTA